jgi:hypothetical protein
MIPGFSTVKQAAAKSFSERREDLKSNGKYSFGKKGGPGNLAPHGIQS